MIKAVFLDRDGLINEFPGNGKYVTTVKDFHFIPGVLEALRILTEQGYEIFIVSNQAGVGKGIYSQQKLDHIHRNMIREIEANGGRIRRTFYCTHRSDQGCNCRKPETGSVREALAMLGKTIRYAKNTYFVGDTEGDIVAGFAAGCSTIFSLSGREDGRHKRAWVVEPDFVVKDLLEAVQTVILPGKRKKVHLCASMRYTTVKAFKRK
ncbi:MAG: HAD-IIIA family hydrolase [Candidatus Omnitrophica bacterium]|nr:HAD-IIIA family hydrolase [Candidatus Omnitrophota bacterium]